MLQIHKDYNGRWVIRKGVTKLTFPKDINSKLNPKLWVIDNFLIEKLFRREEKVFPQRTRC